MNSSLAAFMKVAFTCIILSGLLIGIVYQTLATKNDTHADLIENKFQLKEK